MQQDNITDLKQCFSDLTLESEELNEVLNKMNTILEEREKEKATLSKFIVARTPQYKKACYALDKVSKFFQRLFPEEAIVFSYEFASESELREELSEQGSDSEEQGSDSEEQGSDSEEPESDERMAIIKIYYAGRDAIGEVHPQTLELAQLMMGKLFDCKYEQGEYNDAHRGGFEIIKKVGTSSPYYYSYKNNDNDDSF